MLTYIPRGANLGIHNFILLNMYVMKRERQELDNKRPCVRTKYSEGNGKPLEGLLVRWDCAKKIFQKAIQVGRHKIKDKSIKSILILQAGHGEALNENRRGRYQRCIGYRISGTLTKSIGKGILEIIPVSLVTQVMSLAKNGYMNRFGMSVLYL